MLVVLLLTPLQAAGEEYAFRGYLTQAFGGLFAPLPPGVRALRCCCRPLLFALAHGAQERADLRRPVRLRPGRRGPGRSRTGGLEAGIAMHVLNNLLAFGVALAFSDMSDGAQTRPAAPGGALPVTLTQSLVYLGS